MAPGQVEGSRAAYVGKITAIHRQSARWRQPIGKENHLDGPSDDRALGCSAKLNVLKALSLRFLPDGMDRKAGEIRQVGGPRTH